MDITLVNETRNVTYKRLADLAAKTSKGAIDADSIYKQLAIPDTIGADGYVNVGNSITNDLKWTIKVARLLGIHVSPTVVFDGVVVNDISSSFTVEQWQTWLNKNVV